MEELYRSVLPDATIHSIDWSSLNLLALSVSVVKRGFVGEGFGSSKSHQLLVVDANRPWKYHCVYGDNKAVTQKVAWSLCGRRLLSVEQDSVARVWKMKDNCLNSWLRLYRIQLTGSGRLLHASWVECQPLPNVNCSKEAWPELLEYHPRCSYLQSVVPEAAIFVYTCGMVQLVSFAGAEPVQSYIQLDVEGNLCASRTLAVPDGSILCVVVCSDGLVKLFVLNVSLSTEGGGGVGGGVNVTASLSTSFHPTGGGGGQLTDLIIHPDTGGCLLHICYDKTNLLQWSLRDITQSGAYMAKRESLYIIQQPVTCIACTALCLKGCGPSPSSLVTTPATGSEFMLDVGGGDSSSSSSKNWPVELIIMLHADNTVTILNRMSYQVLCNGKLSSEKVSTEPASKRARAEVERGCGNLSLCLSPNGGCIAVTNEGTLSVTALSPFVLGEKGFVCPEISRWSVLLALAAVKSLSVWDIAVMCSRVSYQQKDTGLVMKLLEQWSEDFVRNSDNWRDHLLSVYHQTCLTLHCCHPQGLALSLDQRDILRLHATFSIFLLALPSSSNLDMPPSQSLKECSESPEDNLDSITRSLQVKDFSIEKDISSQLQGHAHWIIEFAIKVTSRIAAFTVERYPDRMSLRVLRQCLMLLFIWNKGLNSQVLAIGDAALSLLFKVITYCINNEIACLDEALKGDVLRNLPPDEQYSTLTLTKAANLQGFLHGLSRTDDLPETFYRDTPPRLRPHVQAHYSAYDPYSPLGLIIPKGLSPPWNDGFVEGQLDVIHGGLLTNAVVRDAKLRQCNNCRCWTVFSGHSSNDSSSSFTPSVPIQQWRYSWSQQCLCGSLWLNTKQ